MTKLLLLLALTLFQVVNTFTVVAPVRTARPPSAIFAKAAKSKEEDLEMTLKVIKSFGTGESGDEAPEPEEVVADEAPKKEKKAKGKKN